MGRKWPRVAANIQGGLERTVGDVQQLEPDDSSWVFDRWWRAFLPGILRETSVREAVLSLKIKMPKASKAEFSYSHQEGGSFFLLTDAMLPVFRFNALAPPPAATVAALIRGAGTPGPDWSAVCNEAMDWTLVLAHDGPFFLRRVARTEGDEC